MDAIKKIIIMQQEHCAGFLLIDFRYDVPASYLRQIHIQIHMQTQRHEPVVKDIYVQNKGQTCYNFTNSQTAVVQWCLKVCGPLFLLLIF